LEIRHAATPSLLIFYNYKNTQAQEDLSLDIEFKFYLKQKILDPPNYLIIFLFIVVLIYFGTFVLLKLETPFPII